MSEKTDQKRALIVQNAHKVFAEKGYRSPRHGCRNQYWRNQAPRSESWRTQVYYTGGP